MIGPVLCDTGPLFATVDPCDQFHDRAMRELDLIAGSGQGLAVPAPVLIESYSLVLRKDDSRIALRWLQEISSSASLLITGQIDFDAPIQTLVNHPDQHFTLVDAVVAAVSHRLDLEIWTYDAHFDVLRANVWR